MIIMAKKKVIEKANLNFNAELVHMEKQLQMLVQQQLMIVYINFIRLHHEAFQHI